MARLIMTWAYSRLEGTNQARSWSSIAPSTDSLKEELHMVLNTGEQLAKRSELGNLSSLPPGPESGRFWAHYLALIWALNDRILIKDLHKLRRLCQSAIGLASVRIYALAIGTFHYIPPSPEKLEGSRFGSDKLDDSSLNLVIHVRRAEGFRFSIVYLLYFERWQHRALVRSVWVSGT
jgi:hypothetical protein